MASDTTYSEKIRIGLTTSYDCVGLSLPSQIGGVQLPSGRELEVCVNSNNDCDALVIANYPGIFGRIRVSSGTIIKLVQEPMVTDRRYRWVTEHPNYVTEVFSPFEGEGRHGHLPWHVTLSRDDLLKLQPPAKSRNVSAVISTKAHWPGHRNRLRFVEEVLIPSGVDLFGRGRNLEVDRKEEALLPYRFSVAIENQESKWYVTEKLFDPILCWSVPLYFGARGVHRLLPPKSFIWLPMDEPKEATRILNELKEEDYSDRLDDLGQARLEVLDNLSLGGFVRTLAREVDKVGFSTRDAKAVFLANSYLIQEMARNQLALQISRLRSRFPS